MGSVFSTRTYDPVFMLMIALSSAVCRINLRSGKHGEEEYMVPLINRTNFLTMIAALISLKLFMMQAW
jgi:hypothetical protein